MTRNGLEFNHAPSPERGDGGLSSKLFSESAFNAGDSTLASIPPASGDQIVFSSPFEAKSESSAQTPLLDSGLLEQLEGADKLTLSSAAENAASGAQPDYRVVKGEDGSLVMEKVGDGDPLADGELNIEMNSGDKSLEESIKNADKGLKEYYRELISAWQSKHPGKNYPSWWNDILQSQPAIPSNASPVPVRQASAKPQPAPESTPQPRSQPTTQPSAQPSSAPSSRGASPGGFPGGSRGASTPSVGGRGRGGGDGRGAGYEPGGRYRGEGEKSNRAHSGATPNTDQQNLLQNVRTVVDVAKEKGVDPKLAVAMMLVESGGDNRAVGDNGTSFGLFQLHRGGMLTEAGLTKDQAFDPRTNAEVSLGNLAKIDDKYADPGTAAAKSQRPANPLDYAAKVNASMDEAAELIAMADKQGPAVAQNDVREVDGYSFPVAGYQENSVKLHWGEDKGATDIFANRGTPVVAVQDGVVTNAGHSEVGGYHVSLKLDNGLEAYYAHLDQPPVVAKGDRVESGQQLGVVGDSGNAKGTGTHLHFGMGDDIRSGAGPQGGSGTNFDTVAVLNNVLKKSHA